MPALLVPCTACARHIRASEDACPFCATGVPDRARLPTEASPSRGRGPRLSRAAIFLAGATAATAAVAGCGKTTAGGSDTSSTPTSIAAPYGAPPMDSGLEVPIVPPVPAYGGPPPGLDTTTPAPTTTTRTPAASKDGGAPKK